MVITIIAYASQFDFKPNQSYKSEQTWNVYVGEDDKADEITLDEQSWTCWWYFFILLVRWDCHGNEEFNICIKASFFQRLDLFESPVF